MIWGINKKSQLEGGKKKPKQDNEYLNDLFYLSQNIKDGIKISLSVSLEPLPWEKITRKRFIFLHNVPLLLANGNMKNTDSSNKQLLAVKTLPQEMYKWAKTLWSTNSLIKKKKKVRAQRNLLTFGTVFSINISHLIWHQRTLQN